MTKKLIITGGSKGIGRAIIAAFVDDGYSVLNLSRTPPAGVDVQHVNANLTAVGWLEGVSAKISTFAADAEDLVVVHCAALHYGDSMQTVPADALARVMQVNVIAPVQLNQLLLPHMGAGSAIIYIGSTLSEKAVPGSCSYVTSKHAVVGLMRSTCQDLAGTGVHTACVCPGFTDTEMLRSHIGDDEAVVKSITGNVAFGRLIQPQEIAATVVFCARNPVVNGAVLHANLGQIER